MPHRCVIIVAVSFHSSQSAYLAGESVSRWVGEPVSAVSWLATSQFKAVILSPNLPTPARTQALSERRSKCPYLSYNFRRWVLGFSG